jgi:hypothetical protein
MVGRFKVLLHSSDHIYPALVYPGRSMVQAIGQRSRVTCAGVSQVLALLHHIRSHGMTRLMRLLYDNPAVIVCTVTPLLAWAEAPTRATHERRDQGSRTPSLSTCSRRVRPWAPRPWSSLFCHCLLPSGVSSHGIASKWLRQKNPLSPTAFWYVRRPVTWLSANQTRTNVS